MIYDQRAFEVQGWSMIIRAHELAPHNRRGGYHLKAVEQPLNRPRRLLVSSCFLISYLRSKRKIFKTFKFDNLISSH